MLFLYFGCQTRKSMQTTPIVLSDSLEEQNRELLKLLVKKLGSRSNYAATITERLQAKGVTVSEQQVYQTGSGHGYNQTIAQELIELVKEKQQRDEQLNTAMKELLDQ